MIRIVVVLFWVSLLVGTLLAHNIVANWAVALAGLYFLVRWWTTRKRESRAAKASAQPIANTASSDRTSPPSPAVPPASPTIPPHSRWTVDRVRAAERHRR